MKSSRGFIYYQNPLQTCLLFLEPQLVSLSAVSPMKREGKGKQTLRRAYWDEVICKLSYFNFSFGGL